MARPTKQGITYFPLDCELDSKHKMYRLELGAAGYGILIELWQMIYSNDGYYIESSDDVFLLIKSGINADINLVNDCINVALKRGIFDKNLFDSYKILTSKAIQKRFFDAAKRKKKVSVVSDYLLIDVSEYKNLVNVDINGVNVSKNATNVNVNVNVNTKEKEKEKADSGYAFEGEKIKLNAKDYQECQTLYPLIDLDYWLRQLDVALRDKKDWYMTMHAKMQYQNQSIREKQNATNRYQGNTKPSLQERAIQQSANLDAFIASVEANEAAVGTDDGDIRLQVGTQ